MRHALHNSRQTHLLSAGLLAACAALSACGGGASPTTTSQDAEGREETRNIRNTQSIGYSGDAIANQVDAALDANEQRNQDIRNSDEY